MAACIGKQEALLSTGIYMAHVAYWDAAWSHLITGSCSGRNALSGVTEPNKLGCADLQLTGREHGAVLY